LNGSPNVQSAKNNPPTYPDPYPMAT
jgi:hypothetical protein